MYPAIVLAASASSVGQHALVFPCTPGKTLTYRAEGQWEQGAGPSTIIRKSLTWHTSFLDCSYTRRKAVAIVNGLPMDLAWYQPGAGPAMYAVIQTPEGVFIQQDFSYPGNDLQAIKPASDDQYLGFPVEADTCAERKELRPDGDYCWFVSSTKEVSGKESWKIEYRTLPDYSCVTIEPGVGITSYAYHHNGTVEEVNVSLVRVGKMKFKSGDNCPNVNF